MPCLWGWISIGGVEWLREVELPPINSFSMSPQEPVIHLLLLLD
jgi:hypothetical protein